MTNKVQISIRLHVAPPPAPFNSDFGNFLIAVITREERRNFKVQIYRELSGPGRRRGTIRCAPNEEARSDPAPTPRAKRSGSDAAPSAGPTGTEMSCADYQHL